MRVAYVCADPGVPVFGSKGSSVHVRSVLRALVRRGAHVELLTTRVGGRAPAGLEGVRVHRLPSLPDGNAGRREQAALAANAGLEALLDALEPVDLVYERCSLWSHAALERAHAAGIPSVLEVNSPLIEEQATHRVLVARRTAEEVADRQAACASVLVAVSDQVADHLRSRHPAAAARVRVVPNGVDPERFPESAAAGRRAPGHPFTVGFLGTLKPWHGLPVLVEAFEALRAREPDAQLLVVGDGPERPVLEADLARRGLRGAATLTGAVAPEAVPGALASADVAVAPYPPLESCYFSPLKVLESMAAGLPVVASRVGQLESLIEDGRTGVLVPAGDPVRLADALAALAGDPDRRRRLGAAARRSVLAHHTWDQVLDRILASALAARPALERA